MSELQDELAVAQKRIAELEERVSVGGPPCDIAGSLGWGTS